MAYGRIQLDIAYNKATTDINDAVYFLDYIKVNGIEWASNSKYFDLPQKTDNIVLAKCKTGYMFDSANMSVKNSDGTAVRAQATLSDNNTVATWTINSIYNSGSSSNTAFFRNNTLEGSYKDYIKIINAAPISSIPVTKTLTNANTNLPNSVEVGETYNININANAGYYFSQAPVLNYTLNGNNIEVPLTRIDDKQYIASFTVLENTTAVTLTGIAIEEPAPAEITTVSITTTHCSVLPNINTIEIGNTINFTINADNGYIFDIAPVIRYKNDDGVFITLPPVKVSDYEYTAAVTLATGERDLRISATANAESQTSEKYGAIQIHKVTKENIKDFESLKLFRGSGGGLEEIDITQYIAAFKMLFIDVTSASNDNILVADIDTQINAAKIDNDLIELDLGSFTINGYYGNALDIKYSEVKLTLPFIDIVTLESAKVINKTISVKYTVSLLTGNCIAYIYDITDNNNILLSKYNGNMAFDIPYIKTISGDNKVTLGGETNILFNTAPKVTYSQKLKADSNNNIYTTSKTGLIGNESGYFRCKNVTIDIATSSSEKQQIETLLKSGVYI